MHIKRIPPRDRTTFLLTILIVSHIPTSGGSSAPRGIRPMRNNMKMLNAIIHEHMIKLEKNALAGGLLGNVKIIKIQ